MLSNLRHIADGLIRREIHHPPCRGYYRIMDVPSHLQVYIRLPSASFSALRGHSLKPMSARPSRVDDNVVL